MIMCMTVRYIAFANMFILRIMSLYVVDDIILQGRFLTVLSPGIRVTNKFSYVRSGSGIDLYKNFVLQNIVISFIDPYLMDISRFQDLHYHNDGICTPQLGFSDRKKSSKPYLNLTMAMERIRVYGGGGILSRV